MEHKKSKQANLENKRPLFFQLGLVVALSACLVAFEWKGKGGDKLASLDDTEGQIIDDAPEVRRTRPEEPEIKQEKAKVPETITAVDDDKEILDEFTRIDDNDLLDEPLEWETGEEEKWDDTEVIPVVRATKKPSFMGGGIEEFRNYVQSKVKYPRHLQELDIQGRVYVRFVVDKNGKMRDIQIVKTEDEGFSDAVMDVMYNAPDEWEAGEQGVYKVNVEYYMPVIFKLEY
jgi:periplasmic protein TonB